MRGLTLLGVVLIAIGVAALAFGHFSYTETEQAAKVGPVQIQVEKQHDVSIPTIAGIVVVFTGLGMILLGRRGA